jgi:hypothetical protein
MSLPDDIRSDAGSKSRLRPLDWVLLPLISVSTILLLVGATEFSARWKFKTLTADMPSCLISNDPSTGLRGLPNSVCLYKHEETPMVEYQFNSCGHRAGMECGPKPPGVYRIVMVGSSYAMGLGVPRGDTFAALLPKELDARTGRKIELYDEGMIYGVPRAVALRVDDALAPAPDMILWVLTPWDIETTGLGLSNTRTGIEPMLPGGKKEGAGRFTSGFVTGAIKRELYAHLHGVRFAVLHYLYSSEHLYRQSYLLGKDTTNGFLRASPSAFWQERARDFETYAKVVQTRAGNAHVRLVVVLLPDRTLADMISGGQWPQGYDPFKLDNELRTIVVENGGIYIDVLPEFRNVPNAAQHYYPIDNHPDSYGHAIISKLLAEKLTGGAIPELRSTAPRMLQ